ncbi:MAG: hypothetical protein HOV80_21235 [Polyangiaceae bacterium]|nr:hypothetical protein [Polyangiaceae bacterium]
MNGTRLLLFALVVLALGCEHDRERPDDTCAELDNDPGACGFRNDRVRQPCTYVKEGEECAAIGAAKDLGCFGTEFVDCEADSDCPGGYVCEQVDVPSRPRSTASGVVSPDSCATVERGLCFAE